MALVMNLLFFLFSGVLVHSSQSTVPLKSFKIGENVTYDCIDIYMQSGLDHPLLKNHTIQMKPSVSRTELKSQIGINKVQKQKIPCPDGTIPVWRNTKEFTTNAQVLAENHVHSLSPDSPGTHINPSFFGDGRTWTYGFWKGKDGKGCYNTACSGFVQVSQTVPIVQPIDFPAGQFLWLHYSIHQDKNTGNWWLTELGNPNVDIGYWPKELFNLLDNGANMVGAGGVVRASRSGSSPEMGNGQFPNINHPRDSAIFTNIEVLDSNYVQYKMNYFPTEVVLDSPKCYELIIGKEFTFQRNLLGFYFNYGGPGGNSCGV
ncbi:hypothetical protein Bca52824_029977 [Brassica carinata]|uniref:Neprosin PEP catalytic domain-containing protein n=1 Tax=Brassica carinata TaxID=52824 RepID=A0A8X7V6B3_BRACI|nr:hypothetical protein Bca52824_029977 [Brassica carinata]